MSTISFGAIGGSNRDSGSGYVIRDGTVSHIVANINSGNISGSNTHNSHLGTSSNSNSSNSNRSSGTHLALNSHGHGHNNNYINNKDKENKDNNSNTNNSGGGASNLNNSSNGVGNSLNSSTNSTTTTVDFEFQISFTQLVTLPPSIYGLIWLQKLVITHHNIRTLSEDIGLKDIIAFLRELETGARPCLRSKLVVVGDEKVGKSSVIQCIRGKKKKGSSSSNMEGIEIDQHEFDVVFDDDADRKRKTITVSTWDIVNQDVYFTTNQLFASDRSVHRSGATSNRVPSQHRIDHLFQRSQFHGRQDGDSRPPVDHQLLKSEESETRHLIPTLLPRDGNLVSQWEDFDCPDKIRLNRQYHLPYIPEKFFGKLILRLLHFVKVESCLKNVVVVRNQQGHDALIELKTLKGTKSKVLVVNVRGLPKPVGLLRILTDTIESLFSQWYKLDIKRYVSCFECSFLYDENPTLFPIEDCEEAVMDGKTLLNCFRNHDKHDEKSTHRLPLDVLVPDIAMVDIPRPRFDLKDIKLIKEVGQGAFGIVYEAEWNGEIVALKKLIPPTGAIGVDNLSTDDEKKEDRLRVFREFRHEVYSMSRLNHPNAMKISGFCLQPLCMALEFVKYGSLYNLLANNLIEIGWGLRLQIATEIAKGMQHMHSLNPPMIHRDLKSPNILMHGVVEGVNPVSTIIDYGTSTELYGGAALARCVDQPLWLAPEVMASMAYSEPSDVYAFGIILWELYTRSHPFDEYSFGQWMSKLEDEIIRGLRPNIPASCPPEYVELIQSCWTHEPNSRPTFTSIVESLANLKKKLVPIQSTLPPHIRNQARKSRSASFSEWSSTSIASGLGASINSTNSSLNQSREQLSASITTQATFNHTTSSSSISSGGDSDDVLTLDDLISLEIFTEEEIEQPYPFVDDDQRGILFGYDEEQTSSVSIVIAATLAKMIEMMTRNDGGSMSSNPAIQMGGALSGSSGGGSGGTNTAASGRKRSDTAGKSGLPVPQWRNSLPLSPNGNVTTLDESFIEDFIHLYRSFTTPQAVLKMLVKRFFGPRPDKSDSLTMRKFEQRRAQIRVGVSNFMKRWCADITEFEYHQDDAWLYHKVDEFVHLCYGNDQAIVNSIGTILDNYDPEIKKAKEEEKLELSIGSKLLHRTSTDVGRSGSFSLSSAASLQLNISKSFINLAIAIKDPLYGVPLRERKFKNKVVTRCFSGSDAVDWICRMTSSSRDDANTLAIDLFTRHFFFILGEDGSPIISKGGNRNEFYDSQFYTFHDDDPELLAHQYTFLELDYLHQIHPRELLGYSVGLAASDDVQTDKAAAKHLNFPNICNYFQWFQKMSLLAASEIVKQRDIRSRSEMIERYIKIALEYLSLWNFNGVMQVLCALHSDPITRLTASWARISQKYIDAFHEISRLMLPESNYLPLRTVISSLPGSITQTYQALTPYMTHVICPTIPFLGALVADLSQTSTENPTFISSGGEKMTNILRVKRLSKKMKMFKEYKEMPSVYRPPLLSTPYVWYGGYMNEVKAFDYNQIDRLSEFERRLEIEAEKNGTLGDDKEKEGEQSMGNSDSLGYGNEELTERDWSVLLTNATVITYHRGDVVIEENTINSYLYRIKSGTLGVEKRNKDGKSVKVASMGAPKMFGEMSFLGNKTTARVVVDDQADLYVMDIPFLNSLFVSHPRLGAKFYKIMANQLAVRLKNLPTMKPPQQSPASSPLSSPHLGSPSSSTSTASPPTSPPRPIVPPIIIPTPSLTLSGSTGSTGSNGNSSSSSNNDNNNNIVKPNNNATQPLVNINTPPASPRTPNQYLANLHPALSKRTSTSANFSPRERADTSLLSASNSGNNNIRSNSISRTQTSAQLGEPIMKKNDQEFCQRFSLYDEIVIKDYACSLTRSGRCYISQGHVCFYSKFFGYKTKKVIPFKQITGVLCANNTQIELSRLKNMTTPTNYRFTFQNNKDRQDAYGIINSLHESSKQSNTSDDLKQKMQQERKKQNMTLKTKHHSKDQLTKEDWELIGREGSRCHTFKKDEPIVKQGERIQKIFQIGKGVCRIEKLVPSTNDPNRFHSVVLGTMKQDETFGEITYLLSGEVTANVIADSQEVEVYAIEGQFVNILFDLNPSLATKWFKYLATALNKTLIEREAQLYN
ncbi:RasGEF domain-containing protein [Heterostelium album PN500]|uniref:RasGEF domain-containing protein n=1 Tax=Heterostelium pallidum (strain ATCC 26659 / Pp 5 / PN500) TaxID=670386 RepID=D3BLW9_HETP5|nr:RasGEF domain-containing protein [Heterostelium album PN500]EFA77570.1 RasGEF domain-containing protein [Heterostelium album PN500]|eukprot:XP_020429698.1 RasGEF domain-containing protein [Heterostelium album PN500]